MRLRRHVNEGPVPLADLLRRLEIRGFEIQKVGDLHFLTRGLFDQVYAFTDPVPEEVVHGIATFFGVERRELYFDRTPRDLNS